MHELSLVTSYSTHKLTYLKYLSVYPAMFNLYRFSFRPLKNYSMSSGLHTEERRTLHFFPDIIRNSKAPLFDTDN